MQEPVIEFLSIDINDNGFRVKGRTNEHPKWKNMDTALQQFVEISHKNKDIHAPQGSEDWLRMRVQKKIDPIHKLMYGEDDDYVVCTGGSEISTLLHMNHFQQLIELHNTKVYSLIHGKSKPKLDNDPKNKSLHLGTWGHLTEPIFREYVETLFGTKFYEIDGSVPHPRIPYSRYSPDGLGVIRVISDGKDYNSETMYDYKDKDMLEYVVLELKCPWARVVSGEFPIHYLPQPLSGTSVFPFVTSALFAEGNWKVKPLKFLFTAYYNARIHYQSSINGKTKGERYDDLFILDATVIQFYSEINYYGVEFYNYGTGKITIKAIDTDIEEEVNPNNLENGADPAFLVLSQTKMRYTYTHNNQTYNLVDFGGVGFDEFYLLMRAIDKGLIKIRYAPSYYKTVVDKKAYDPYVQLNEFNTWCSDNKVYTYGFLPMSLYTFAAYYLHGDKYFVDGYLDKLKKFSTAVKKEYKNKQV